MELRVLIHAPRGRDAAVVRGVLRRPRHRVARSATTQDDLLTGLQRRRGRA